MSQPKPDNTTQQQKYQSNAAQFNPLYQQIFNLIKQENFNQHTFRMLLQKFAKSEKAKIFLRLIPHINVPKKTLRSLGAVAGVSHEEMREWIDMYAPEILKEKMQRGGDKT